MNPEMETMLRKVIQYLVSILPKDGSIDCTVSFNDKTYKLTFKEINR